MAGVPLIRPRLLAAAAVAFLVLCARAPLAAAETAEDIIAMAEANRQVENSVQTVTMILYDRAGQARTQTLESRIKQTGTTVKTYGRLTAPADKAGVQFLTIQSADAPDEQYVAFPGSGVSRIAGGSKRGAFLGSDFTYEDLELGQPHDATHQLLGEETITVSGQALPCWKIESVPKPALASQYSRIVTWIQKDGAVPRQLSLYDTRGAEWKRMILVRTSREGPVVVPLETEMRNLLKGTRTVIRVDKYRINVPAAELPDTMFTADHLAKAR